MTNPFMAKAKTRKTNPFVIKKANPFINKPVSSNGDNPFVANAKEKKANKLAEVDRLIAEAEERYSDSLDKALKGKTPEQTKERFDASDRYMRTLLNLSAQRKRIVSGADVKPKKKRKKPGPKPKPKSVPKPAINPAIEHHFGGVPRSKVKQAVAKSKKKPTIKLR